MIEIVRTIYKAIFPVFFLITGGLFFYLVLNADFNFTATPVSSSKETSEKPAEIFDYSLLKQWINDKYKSFTSDSKDKDKKTIEETFQKEEKPVEDTLGKTEKKQEPPVWRKKQTAEYQPLPQNKPVENTPQKEAQPEKPVEVISEKKPESVFVPRRQNIEYQPLPQNKPAEVISEKKPESVFVPQRQNTEYQKKTDRNMVAPQKKVSSSLWQVSPPLSESHVRGPVVKLDIAYGEIIYSNFATKKDLTEYSGSNAAGLTTASWKNLFYDIDLAPNGTVKTLYLEGGMSVFLVHVAYEYIPGTMSFNEILKHELTHVAVYRVVAEHYMTNLSIELLALIKKKRLRSKKEYIALLEPVVKKYEEEMIRVGNEKSKIQDKPESYAYQHDQYGKEFNKYLNDKRKEIGGLKSDNEINVEKEGNTYIMTITERSLQPDFEIKRKNMEAFIKQKYEIMVNNLFKSGLSKLNERNASIGYQLYYVAR